MSGATTQKALSKKDLVLDKASFRSVCAEADDTLGPVPMRKHAGIGYLGKTQKEDSDMKDTLARGGRTAQFPSSGSAVNDPVELKNVAEETLGSGITVIDRRSQYNSEPVKKAEPKFPAKEYGVFAPILDRILVKRMSDNPDEELLEDGSSRSVKTGLITAAKYRQHSSTGIVLATGNLIVIGGVRVSMEEVLKPGDWVMWGDYNSEVVHIDEDKIKKLCDSAQVEYTEDPDGVRIVRIQDVRAVKHAIQ
jgi:co-chaperonin GroES (HSP10)